MSEMKVNKGEPLLEVRNLEVHYGGIAAVRGIDLDIMAGETVALIGANGAGKTSTLKALTRLIPCGGTVRYRGEDISKLAAHDLIGRGFSMVPEGRGVFGRLTVAENLVMGAYQRRDKDAIAKDIEHVYTTLPRLAERRNQLAGTLSGGEQQMLAIGRALIGRPQLLLLDEPSMGLAPLMVEKIFEVICDTAASGVAILLVEQNARLALETASRAYVLESGSIALADSSEVLKTDPRITAAYLGES